MGDTHTPQTHHLDKRASRLAEIIDGPDDQVIRTRDAALVLGMSKAWMEAGRHYGFGPTFIHIGPRAVGYKLGDLRAFLASRTTHQCTAEYLPRKQKKRGSA
jgi:predicted DNA-binding transcriptional regulator AlpA